MAAATGHDGDGTAAVCIGSGAGRPPKAHVLTCFNWLMEVLLTLLHWLGGAQAFRLRREHDHSSPPSRDRFLAPFAASELTRDLLEAAAGASVLRALFLEFARCESNPATSAAVGKFSR